MEHPSRRVTLLLVWLLMLSSLSSRAQQPVQTPAPKSYFTLSTSRTFAPGERPKLHLYSHGEPLIEFRVYRVNDPEKFVGSLQEMHSFGPVHHWSPAEQVDEKNALERFHDWKSGLWHRWKEFWRDQLSKPTRDAFRKEVPETNHRAIVRNATQFAPIPLLNGSQLVARWQEAVPKTYVTDDLLVPVEESLGSGMYLVEATDGRLKAYTVLMVSRTALITRTVSGQMVAYVVDRKTGAPVSGASVVISADGQLHRHQTGADGLATFNSGEGGSAETTSQPESGSQAKIWVMARSGNEIALVAPWYSAFTTAVGRTAAVYTYTDRPVYRPGDTVHFKAILRQYRGDTLVLPQGRTVHVTITDDSSKSLLDTDLPISSFGTVSGELKLPADASLGYDTLSVSLGDDGAQSGTTSFRVEDYRKPEYQVRVSVSKPQVLQGEANTATIQAKYFFGEPVTDAKVKYRTFSSAHFWWDEEPGDDDDGNAPGLNAPVQDDAGESGSDTDADTGYLGEQNVEHEGRLDADGKLVVSIPTAFMKTQTYDQDIVVEAGVTDSAGREITARYRFLATYGSFRIHVEPLSYAYSQGEAGRFRVTAVDYNDKPVQTGVHLHLTHTVSSPRGLTSTTTVVGDADVNTGADGTGIAQLPMTTGGSIYIQATAKTPEGRTVDDESSAWVSGGAETGDTESKLRIIADKKSYAPGDVAHLALVSETPDIHALVTATGYSAEFQKVLSGHGKTLQFDLPITRDSEPNLTVDAVYMADDKLYQGHRSLKVPPTQQQLTITVTPAAEVFQPGQASSYDVLAKDSTGRPVAAELSFGVVDEAIYSLYPDTSGDIIKALYPDRSVYPDFDNSIGYFFSGEAGDQSPLLAERHSRYRPQLAQVKPGNDTKTPRIRKNFPDTAFWQPAVRTDANGHARVTLSYPDSLTTWRATVRAVTADSKAGSSVNRVLVRKNVIIRMGQPRFLRKGDEVTIPVIVHNYLPTPKQVTVTLDATGAEVKDSGARQIAVAPRAEGTVNYHLHAGSIGSLQLVAKALTDEESDALQFTLPVKPAGVRRTLASSGLLRDTAETSRTITFPASDPDGHAMRIDVSPSIAGSLFGALDYLSSFPYGCTEQTMSSFLPNIVLRQAMQKLGVPSRISETQLSDQIDAAIKRLRDYRHADGGWGWWKEDATQIFMTSYVVSGLSQARAAGVDEGSDMIAGGTGYLKTQLDAHPRMLPELRAYAVYAMTLAGSAPRPEIDKLYGRRADLSPQALAYTGLSMLQVKDSRAAEIVRLLENRANVQGELASWPASRNNLLDIDYDESAASTAYVLKFLVHADPGSPLLQKAAQWLVANRSQGQWWGSTQDTAFVIYGLIDYLTETQELNANLDVEIFVNGASAGRHHFSRNDALHGETLHIALDPARLQPTGNTLRIVSSGTGRAYWAVQSDYFSTVSSSYQQGTMQLNIARDYYVLTPEQKEGRVVYRLQPLRGPVQQGDVLAVHLGVSGSPQRYLLIEDPIPAGAEFLQRTDGYEIVGRPGGWDDWYTRQEFHDDRAAIFATQFSGRHDSFYLLKVVNPGSYEISPARVSPMYQPEVQATTDPLHLDVREVSR